MVPPHAVIVVTLSGCVADITEAERNCVCSPRMAARLRGYLVVTAGDVAGVQWEESRNTAAGQGMRRCRRPKFEARKRWPVS